MALQFVINPFLENLIELIETSSSSSGGGFQKYQIDSGETYVIPAKVSSVISGPIENAGVIEIAGRLEVLP
jgi:hypothetical protein